jgi:preprotein translocase subunit SecE
MTAYKEDQGRLTRMFAFWSLTFLILFGCNWLHGMLVGQIEAMREPLAGIRIPIVAVDLNIAFLISAPLFAICVVVLWRWTQTPKVADLLIDTETELRKVAWPTTREVVNSSIVVMVFVILLGGFLAGADYLLARIVKYLIWGGA